MKHLDLFLPLSKVDLAQRIVYGVFACEEPDNAGEIMDYESSKPEFEKWSQAQFVASDGKSLGNVRSMHNKIAAGKVISFECDDLKKRFVGAVKVVDDNEWAKVEAGVYTGFSIGGKYANLRKDAGSNLKRYTAIPHELSLADKPCMKSATFEVLKVDGSSELRKFQAPTEDIEQGFRAKDGTFFMQKVAAEKYNESLAKIAAAKTEEAPDHPALAALKKVEDATTKLEGGEEVPPRLKKNDDLNKMMCDVSRLAELVDGLKWLQECLASDKEMTGESSVNPDKVQKQVEALGATLVEMVTAEVQDMAVAKTDGFEGATAAVVARLEKFNLPDGLKKVRVEVDVDLKKALDERDEAARDRDALSKTVVALEGGLEKLNKRLALIERQPAPAKGVLRAVERGNELAKAGGRVDTRDHSGDTLKMPAGLAPMDQRAWMNKNKPN